MVSRCAGCPSCDPGDSVIVETVDATYIYRLDTDPETLVVPFTGVWVLDALPKNPDGRRPAAGAADRARG